MIRALFRDSPCRRNYVLLAAVIWSSAPVGLANAAGEEQNKDGRPTKEWKETKLDFGKDTAIAVAVSPDGKLLAWGHGKSYATKERLAPISIMDVDSGTVVRRLRGHAFDVKALCFIAGGKQLTSGDDNGFMSIWDVRNGEEVSAARPHENMVRSICASLGGKGFASVGHDGQMHLWGDSLEMPIHSFAVDRTLALDVLFSRDGKTVAACSPDHISVWTCDTGTHQATTSEKYDLLSSIDISQDGKSLIGVTARGGIVVLDYPGLKVRANIRTKATHERVRSLPRTECVIAGSGGRVEIYDYAAKRRRYVLSEGDSTGHGGETTDIDASADGAMIAVCHDRHAKLWRRNDAKDKSP